MTSIGTATATPKSSTPTESPVSRAAINEGDRQLRRTCTRFGDEFQEVRLRAGLSQAAVARAVGVARSVICRMEHGDRDVSPRIRARAAAVLGADFASRSTRKRPRSSTMPRMRISSRRCSPLAILAGEPRSKSPVPGPGRRSTDIRFDHRLDAVLVEVESRIRSFEAIIRECADKRAAVAQVLGPDHRVHVALVLPPTRHHKALIAAHPRIVATAFPVSHANLELALSDPVAPWPGDGILWMAKSRESTRVPGLSR